MKKFLALVMALVMTMSLVTVSAGAEDYTDDATITYGEAVDVISALGIVGGYADGTFNPTGTLTRGAAAKIICNMILGPTEAGALATVEAPFKDVPADHVFSGYIAYCVSEGIVSGYADGTFKPAGTLTGYAFWKMLLGALGYDASAEGYTGTNFAVNVAKRGLNIGLNKGLKGDFVGTKALTREEACLYALNALQADMVEYDNSSSITIGDIVISNNSKAEEVENKASSYVVGDTDYTTSGTMQFCEQYFKDLRKNAGSDDAYGRPSSHKWEVKKADGTWKTVHNATRTPVKEYVTGFNATELAALVADDYVMPANTTINGITDTGLTATELARRNYVGNSIELYNTDTNAKTIEEIVMVQGYLTKVVSIVSSYKTATSNYITLAVYNPWATGDVVNVTFYDTASKTTASTYDKLVDKYVKNDYLMTYWKGANVIAANYIEAKDVAVETAVVTSHKYTSNFTGTFVADGATYTMASGYAEATGIGGALTLGKEYKIYVDANGYVVGAAQVGAATATVNYGIVLDYATANGVAASNMTGAAAQAAYENVKLYTADGKVEILGTSFVLNADGVTIDTKKAAAVAGQNGKLVQYTLNAAGLIDTIALATDTAALSGAHTKGSTFEVVSGGTADYATDKTLVFVLKSGVATYTGTNDIVVYTGYANVPAKTYAADKAIAADATKGSAGAVAVSTSDLGTTTAAQYIVLNGAPSVSAGTKTGEYKFTWAATLDGVETTVFYEGATNPFTGVVNDLCTVTFDATTGALKTVVSVTEDIDKINVLTDGYYADDAVVYINEDTVYYQMAGTITDGGITAITGYTAVDTMTLPGEGDTFKVYEYLKTVGTDGKADLVFFFVYQG